MNKEEKKSKSLLLLEIFTTFFKLGCFSFGGGYAMIPLIEREVVEGKKWIGKEKVIDIFAVAESLPGAIALNSSAFVGYSVAGIPGAIAALLGNLTPSVIIVLSLSVLLKQFNNNIYVQKAFLGIRPAIIGLIAYAGYKIGKTAIKDIFGIIVMIIAFIGALFFNIPPIPLIVFGAVVGISYITISNVFVKSKECE